jgi:hypothetical protein
MAAPELPPSPPTPPEATPTDASLLRRYQTGEQAAATQLYKRYADRLLRLAAGQTSPDVAARADAEDIVQSVFRTFFRRAALGEYDLPAGDELWKLLLVIRSGTAHFIEFGRFEGRSKPITPVGVLPPSQSATTFTGTSASSDDKRYFSFSVAATRPVRVELVRVGGDFAKLEIENRATSADVLELEPEEGPNAGTVTLTGGVNYLLRVRATDDAPAQFRVVLTQL